MSSAYFFGQAHTIFCENVRIDACYVFTVQKKNPHCFSVKLILSMGSVNVGIMIGDSKRLWNYSLAVYSYICIYVYSYRVINDVVVLEIQINQAGCV